MLQVQIPLRRRVFDTELFDKVCQLLATGQWFSPGTPASPTNNKADRYRCSIRPPNTKRTQIKPKKTYIPEN